MLHFPKIGSKRKCKHNLQVQVQGEAGCMIDIRNTDSAGGVRVSFSDDPSHELLSSPLQLTTGEMEGDAAVSIYIYKFDSSKSLNSLKK